MKLILICSSLEPGKDGVGDYSRRLGAVLINQGNQVALLALNDRHVNKLSETRQQTDGQEMEVMRIPAGTLQNNIPLIKQWIAAFNPDWLSLQYVIFGYHPKGLPFGLGKHLAAIGKGRRWHIMFHELWLGMAQEEAIKLKLWGTVQRFLIKSLINNLRPAVIDTQTRLYQQHLENMGYGAGYLPLFSNIPVVESKVNASLSGEICLVVFGLIHTGAQIEQLAKDAAQYAQQHNVAVKLTFVGNCGNEQSRWAAACQQEGLPVEILGPQPADKISFILQQAIFGLNSTAIAVVEKSGAFAAMRLHQLPVINVSKPWTPRGIAQPAVPNGIVAYTSGGFENIINNRTQYISPANNVEAIAQQLLNNLLADA